MKAKRKTSTVIDKQLLNAFKDVYSDSEAKKALQEAEKAFRVFKHDPVFSREVLNHA